jgi:predicted kinase
MPGKRIMVILRGLPGSGKSSFAQKLYMKFAGATSNRDRVKLCSADSFFMKEVNPPDVLVGRALVGQLGRPQLEYQFNPALLGQAHQKCWQDAYQACCDDVPLIIIDNTNSQMWEYANYQCLAKLAGYAVTIQEVGIDLVPAPLNDGSPVRSIMTKEKLELWFGRQTHGVPLQAFLAMWWRWELDPQAKPLSVYDTDPETGLETFGLTVEDLDGDADV